MGPPAASAPRCAAASMPTRATAHDHDARAREPARQVVSRPRGPGRASPRADDGDTVVRRTASGCPRTKSPTGGSGVQEGRPVLGVAGGDERRAAGADRPGRAAPDRRRAEEGPVVVRPRRARRTDGRAGSRGAAARQATRTASRGVMPQQAARARRTASAPSGTRAKPSGNPAAASRRSAGTRQPVRPARSAVRYESASARCSARHAVHPCQVRDGPGHLQRAVEPAARQGHRVDRPRQELLGAGATAGSRGERPARAGARCTRRRDAAYRWRCRSRASCTRGR